MSLKLTGVKGFEVTLSNVGKKTDYHTRKALKQGASAIQRDARANAPVDHGVLEEAIVIDDGELGGLTGRKQWTVYVDVNKPSGRGLGTVGDYAGWLHDSFSWNLGPKSQAKSDANGGKVGPLYLTRAIEDNEEEIKRNLDEAIKRAIG